MNTKNQFANTRKTLSGVVVLAVFLFVFSLWSLLAVRTQRVSAKAPLSAVVSLSVDKISFNATDDVVLHVTITNPNSYSIKILKWFTPLDGVERPLFTVLRNGEPVSYIGRMVKRAAPTDMDYIMLAAGESVASDVNLSDYYDVSVSDHYEVMYDVASIQLYIEKEVGQLHDGHLISKPLSMFINGRVTPAH